MRYILPGSAKRLSYSLDEKSMHLFHHPLLEPDVPTNDPLTTSSHSPENAHNDYKVDNNHNIIEHSYLLNLLAHPITTMTYAMTSYPLYAYSLFASLILSVIAALINFWLIKFTARARLSKNTMPFTYILSTKITVNAGKDHGVCLLLSDFIF